MARTDRQKISEAVRLANKTRIRWVYQIHSTDGRYSASVFDHSGHELNITYSPAGRITRLVHWVPIDSVHSSRTPVHTGKLAHALKVIAG